MSSKRLLAILSPLLLLSCGVDTFETTVQGSTKVDGAPGLLKLLPAFAPFEGLTNLDFSSNQEFENQGVDKSDVDSVKVTRLTLKIASPSDQDFSFLESLRFYAAADGKRALVAKKDGIDKLDLRAPNPVLVFDLEDVELAPFVSAPSMSIEVEGTGRQPESDTTLEAEVTLRVDVNVF
ncbi:MAG TPA: hypothetical protein DFS52_21415 [Myxococcales bacterium]|nr:hypothetical protein [Myxococcales bacterium]